MKHIKSFTWHCNLNILPCSRENILTLAKEVQALKHCLCTEVNFPTFISFLNAAHEKGKLEQGEDVSITSMAYVSQNICLVICKRNDGERT